MASGDLAESGPDDGIHINPSVVDGTSTAYPSNFWTALGAHEMGHVMGWRDSQDAGCWAYTVMGMPYKYDPIQSAVLPSSPLCSDIDVAGAVYAQSSANGNYSEPSTTEEDCWDVLLKVTVYHMNGDGSITVAGQLYFLLYTDCSGGPPQF